MNKLLTVLVLSILCFTLYTKCDSSEVIEDIVIRKKININDPPCLQVYSSVKKYCRVYQIPEEYMFSLLYQESRYQGPFHWEYKTNHISQMNAFGPAQILLSTARGINKDTVSVDKLKNNINYNIETACKFIRRLKDKYKDWKTVFGYYNTGQPIVNQYALNIVNKEYTWLK
jgi:hypothetical protein